MTITITNILSQTLQRNLRRSSDDQGRSFERLSTGLRINHASDDAAGLAISESLKSKVLIYNQGIRNLSDGISLLNIADGALNELGSIQARLSELAEQAATGTYSNRQRQVMDKEAQALAKEYNRVARSTSFNGRNLFDGDFGELSLANADSAASSITYGLGGNIGTGTFTTKATYVAGSGAATTRVADVNNDGKDDIVNANFGASTIGVRLGLGDGTFGAAVSFASTDPGNLITGDFNNDGNVDIISANYGAVTFSYHRGNGDGTFAAAASTPTLPGGNPAGLESADLDSDGNLDLAVTDNFTAAITVYKGRGNGSFTSGVSYGTTNISGNMKITDFDQNGTLDIAVGQYNSNTIAILKGDGRAGFAAPTFISTGLHPLSVEAGDFNADGIADLVSLDEYANTFSIHIGNGDATFKARTSYATGNAPFSPKLGDFNGDGKLDIVSAIFSEDVLNIHLGNGDGTFGSKSDIAVGDGAINVSVGDFNDDGVADLFSGNYNANSISILLGNRRDGVAALKPFSIATQTEARSFLTEIKKASERIESQRGHIGAFYARAEIAVRTGSGAVLGYTGANSRITDVDVASEAAQLAGTKILQQASVSLLAQANQQPALALTLLAQS